MVNYFNDRINLCISEMITDIDFEPLYQHQADRSLTEMNDSCSKRKCIICEYYFELCRKLNISL